MNLTALASSRPPGDDGICQGLQCQELDTQSHAQPPHSGPCELRDCFGQELNLHLEPKECLISHEGNDLNQGIQ